MAKAGSGTRREAGSSWELCSKNLMPTGHVVHGHMYVILAGNLPASAVHLPCFARYRSAESGHGELDKSVAVSDLM